MPTIRALQNRALKLTKPPGTTKELLMTKTKGDATRARVIEGAIRVLSATGVIGATTRKIAAESGVRLATLHYHFESKSALLLAVFEALIDETVLAFRKEVKDSTGLDDCIEQVLKAAWRWVTQTRVLQIVQYELTLYALREGAQWLADQQYDAYVRVYRDFLIAVSEKPENSPPPGAPPLPASCLPAWTGCCCRNWPNPIKRDRSEGLRR